MGMLPCTWRTQRASASHHPCGNRNQHGETQLNSDLDFDQGRRRTLVTGGTLLTGLLGVQAARADQAGRAEAQSNSTLATGMLPAGAIQNILRSQGTVSDGVLSIAQERDDLDNAVGPGGIPWKPSSQIRNELHFQMIGGRRAIFDGELPLLDRETNPVIDRILANGLVFQSFHQHFFDL